MKRLFMLSIALLTVLCVNIPLQAATLKVSIDGLESFGNIWSYQMNFTIGGNGNITDVAFNETGQYQWEVAPGVFVYNANDNFSVLNDTLTILADEKSFGVDSRVVDGELFTVTYDEAATLTLILNSFLLASDLITPLDLIQIPGPSMIFGVGDNTLMLTTIPIPTAFWLLGSGLIGMLGIRIKFAG